MERWGVRGIVCVVELVILTGSIIEIQLRFHHEMKRMKPVFKFNPLMGKAVV
jgi:hypothetical protein